MLVKELCLLRGFGEDRDRVWRGQEGGGRKGGAKKDSWMRLLFFGVRAYLTMRSPLTKEQGAYPFLERLSQGIFFVW